MHLHVIVPKDITLMDLLALLVRCYVANAFQPQPHHALSVLLGHILTLQMQLIVSVSTLHIITPHRKLVFRTVATHFAMVALTHPYLTHLVPYANHREE